MDDNLIALHWSKCTNLSSRFKLIYDFRDFDASVSDAWAVTGDDDDDAGTVNFRLQRQSFVELNPVSKSLLYLPKVG